MSAKRCFVISPIGASASDIREHADDVFDFIIKPAAEECGVEVYRADHVQEHGRITDQMFRAILKEDFCIALLTGHNPNVFYELAIAQAAGKATIVLVEKGTELPFDVRDLRCVQYDLKPRPLHEGAYKQELIAHIRSLEAQGWLVEPLLARYGVYERGLSLGGASAPAVTAADLDIYCSGESVDLLHVQSDGSYEPTPASECWYGTFRKGRLRSSGGNATFNFESEVKEPNGCTSRFLGFSQGRMDGNDAYLVYRREEVGGEKNRNWSGVMVLRIPKGGSIFGMWMTTDFLAQPHIALGTIHLDREAPPPANEAVAGDADNTRA